MTKFRDDIDPATTWLWSDPHFGHRNIAEYCHRPPDFESIILENLANDVPEGSTLLCLGDLCYRNNAFFRSVTAQHINPSGRNILILGNHDKQRPSFYKRAGFQVAKPFSITWGETEISFSHYPWSLQDDERPIPANHLRIHGHIHNNGYSRAAFVPFLKQHLNISMEQTKFRPVHLGTTLSAVLAGGYPVAPNLSDIDIAKESHHV